MSRVKLSLEELDKIFYYNESNVRLVSEHVERQEQIDATKIIPPHAVVLELGGRYGLAAAVINHQLDNPRYHVVVEPDEKVQNALQRNRDSHFCQYSIFQGVISEKPMYFYSHGFCSFCSTLPNDTPIPTTTVKELQEKHQLPPFTHLVADCEGGLIDFAEENEDFLSTLEGIYFEQDNKNGMTVDYDEFKEKLKRWGFELKLQGFREYWCKIGCIRA